MPFPLHLLGLVLPGLWLGWKFRLPLISTIGATFLIFETSLIAGASVLSWRELLGNLVAYQMVTILCAVVLAAIFLCVGRSSIVARDGVIDTGGASGFAGSGRPDFVALTTTVVSILAFWLVVDLFSRWTGFTLPLRGYQIASLIVAAGVVGVLLFPICRNLQLFSGRPLFQSLDALKDTRAWLYIAPSVCLGLFAVLMLWLALNAYPSVEDSLTIKLPKAVFAIEANTFLPTNLTDDGRMYISPVYPALIQLLFIINGYTGHALLVFGFINWVICGLVVYGICRRLGASNISSLVATALAMLAPTVIIQGSSEGDDLLAATPFLFALLFFLNWEHSSSKLDASLCGLGLGLSVGIKLFPLFYAPLIPLIVIIAAFRFRIAEILAWLRSRVAGITLMATMFVLALLPHAAANWIAFGSPFYVSKSVLATRNDPFSYDCALRVAAGYLKQLTFSDTLRLVAGTLALPSATRVQTYVANVESFNGFFARMLPFDPPPSCSAWGDQFIVTNWFESDNTFWFGIFGPLLLISCFAVLLRRKQPLITYSFALGFIVWAITFAFTQKYIGHIGRYWSLAILSSSPIVAVFLDGLIRRRFMPAALAVCVLAGALTVAFGLNVLNNNTHRSLGQITRDEVRYDFFPDDVRASVEKADIVNVQVIYGINTYDYYMLMKPGAKLLNKNAILSDSLNFALVRSYGLMDNPFRDPRIAVRMDRPFARGFKYLGEVPMGLGFANNIDLSEAERDGEQEHFLLFYAGFRKEGNSFIGTLTQIADPTVANQVRVRIGWVDRSGRRTVPSTWLQGSSMDFSLPADSAKMVVEASFGDDPTNLGVAEWPLTGFTRDISANWKR